MADIVMPQLGESVTEGTITKWFKQVGDSVAEDEILFEVSTDKVDSEVPSPAAGVIAEILVPEGETVDVGTPLVRLAEAGAAAPEAPPAPAAPAPAAPAPVPAAPVAAAPAAPAPVPAAPAEAAPAPAPAAPAPAPSPSVSASAAGEGQLLSPLVRRLIEEHQLDPATLTGTGVGGRITREDVLDAVDIASMRVSAAPAAPAPAAPAAPAPAAPAAPAPAAPNASPSTPPAGARPAQSANGAGESSRVPLSNIRRRTGEHMIASLATSPHVITAIDVDYEAVERARKPIREAFKAEEGFSLTYLPFIARAVVDALREFPYMNASVEGGELVVHHGIHLSIAVDLNHEGLLAPVVQGAGDKRLRAIARDIHDLADRARSKRLSPDELSGGTFTLSNSGSYGTLLVAPIINQPQVAILSTDGVKRRPVVVELPDGTESIGIHSVGNLTLSWDHRPFDGAYAAAFMQRVKEILETRDWVAEL